jgi:ATP-binding cassette subfamily B protein
MHEADSIAILGFVSPFRRLLEYALPYRHEFLKGLAAVIATTAIALTGPRVLQYAIDDLTLGVTRAKLAYYGALLVAVGIGGGVFRFLMRRVLIGASRHIEYDLRNDFFARLQTLPASYFHRHRTGDLMSRATNDLNAVRMMIGPSVMYAANTILGFGAAIGLMLSIDARLTLLSLVPLPFVSLSVKLFGSAIHKRFEQIQAQLSEVSAVAQESLSGVRVVRAYRQEAAELDRFRLANEEYLRRNRRLIFLQGFFFPSMGFFLGLGSLLVLWLGSREVIGGRMTVGEFVAFNAYLTMLAWPMIAFGWVTNMIQRGMASWKRMLEVLDTVPAIRDEPGGEAVASVRTTAPIRGDIEVRDLVFSYGGRPVLNHISFRIPAGQTAALVGPTGSGKSTLVNLLPRLQDPPPGTVFIDGTDVRLIPLAKLRGSIGFVPQEPFLFSDTVGDNIAFGLDGANGAGGSRTAGRAGGPGTAGGTTGTEAPAAMPTRGREEPSGGIGVSSPRVWGPAASEEIDHQARIEQAAAIARLDKDVNSFPKGYDTMVGERGITLSGGQKQRTAIARAVVIDPRILILDDALSAVDTYTEEEILSRLRSVMRQRTSIVVSHRISTVRDADQILVLDEGRIVERGTHDDLVNRGGLYAELHRKQLLEEELAAS